MFVGQSACHCTADTEGLLTFFTLLTTSFITHHCPSSEVRHLYICSIRAQCFITNCSYECVHTRNLNLFQHISYWWCPLCSVCAVHPMPQWGTHGRLAARSLQGDARESTPSVAAGRECGANGDPSKTERKEEQWVREVSLFSRCYSVLYRLFAIQYLHLSFSYITNSITIEIFRLYIYF